MLRQIEQIPYIKDLVKRLRRNPYLRPVSGSRDRAPSEAHFSQFKKRIKPEGFRIIEAWLRREALRLRSQPLSVTSPGRARAAEADGKEESNNITRNAASNEYYARPVHSKIILFILSS